VASTSEVLAATGAANVREALRAIYTDARLMSWWLSEPATLRDRAARAVHCRRIAEDPRGRYGLPSAPEGASAEVKAAIDEALAEVRRLTAGMRARIRRLRAAGHAWDTCWSWAGEGGFGPGDAALLGLA